MVFESGTVIVAGWNDEETKELCREVCLRDGYTPGVDVVLKVFPDGAAWLVKK